MSSASTSSHARLRNATSRRSVGAGDPHFAGDLQICVDLRRGKAGGGQAVRETGAEQRGRVCPAQPRHIEAHEGVPAVAVHG